MKIQSMIPIALYVRHRVGVRSSEVLADVAVNRDIVVRGDEVVKVREEEGACLGLVVTNGHCKWRRQRLSCIPCSRRERRTLHKSEIAKALLLLRFVLCGGGGESDRNDTPSHLVGWLPNTDRWMAKLLPAGTTIHCCCCSCTGRNSKLPSHYHESGLGCTTNYGHNLLVALEGTLVLGTDSIPVDSNSNSFELIKWLSKDGCTSPGKFNLLEDASVWEEIEEKERSLLIRIKLLVWRDSKLGPWINIFSGTHSSHTQNGLYSNYHQQWAVNRP